MIIKELQLRNYPYKSRKGLSEKLAKKYFEKKGYEVFRGYAIFRNSTNYHLYPNVKKKYDRLERILIRKMKLLLYILRTELTSGLPDFLLYRSQDKDMCFAEIKLEHEQIKSNQIECIKLLESYNFRVMIIRIKSKVYRAEINFKPIKKEKTVLIKQEKIRKLYKKTHWTLDIPK